MKYIYIINGRADKLPQYKEFYNQLKETPHHHEVYTTLGEGDATRYVRLYCDLHPEEEVCFVACGGNGIINGVASGLMGYLEYIKSESENTVAPNFTMAILYFGGTTQDLLINLPGRDFHSVKDMLAGTVTPVDIIRINDSYCVNVCNIGFNSTVASRANEPIEVPYADTSLPQRRAHHQQMGQGQSHLSSGTRSENHHQGPHRHLY